jgi:phosphohistidine phosphatase
MIVELFLIRHAFAPPAVEGQPDAERPLGEKGRKRFARCVRGLDELGVRFDRLFHSPMLRAVETAELCTGLLDGESSVCAALAGPPSARILVEFAPQEGQRIALVGHEPWLGELCSLLLCGEIAQAGAFPFRKGGVAWLTGRPEPAGMHVRAFLPPRVMRRI